MGTDPTFAGGVFSVLPEDSRESVLAKRDASALLDAWGGKSDRFIAQLETCRQDIAQELFLALNSNTADQDVSRLLVRISVLLFELSTIAGSAVAFIAEDKKKPYAIALQMVQLAVTQTQAQLRSASA